MVSKNKVSVPASPAVVRQFINENRQKYVGELKKLEDLLRRLRRTEPALRSAYKVYSRGDSQQGEELKSPRKVRLKFNEYHLKQGNSEGSLFDMPDIVGLTIVVSYPSDISAVASALDRAIDRKELKSVALGSSDPAATIATKYGRAIESKGYFACHYNVRMPGVGVTRPIIEVQIKTLLHDAWGAKTHDLTYKPTGRIGAELLTSFDLLGSNLANLDQQSDALRQSIARSAAVRELKRRRIQRWILANSSEEVTKPLPPGPLRGELLEIHHVIGQLSESSADEDVVPTVNRLIELFDQADVAASTLLCYLAAVLQRPAYFEQAQETISAREDACSEDLDRVAIRFTGALAAFAAGDVGEAIDMAEEALEMANGLGSSGYVSDPRRLTRILIGLNSDLAYYYADLIGSHDGDKRNAEFRARSFIEDSMSLYAEVGMPAEGLHAADEAIIATLQDAKMGPQAFFSLDNEAYVLIQTASSIEDLRKVLKRLEFLHAKAPAGLEESTRLAADYHDYCARARLAELERGLLI